MTEIEIEIELDRKVSRKRKKEIEELVKQTIGKRLKIEEMRWIRRET